MSSHQAFTLSLSTLCALLAFIAQADTVIITTADGVNGADAFVQNGTPDANYNISSLTVKDAPPAQVPNSTTRKVYMRYDMRRLGAANVTNATLEVTVSVNNSGGSDPTPRDFTVFVWGMDDGDPGETWGEGTVTWNNAPANDKTSATGMLANAAYLGSFPVTSSDVTGTTVSFNDDNLAAFVNDDTDGVVTLVMTRLSTSGGYNLVFHARESTGNPPPTLRLGTESIYVTPFADAYVRYGTPDQNYGPTGDMPVKNSGGSSTTRKAYVAFDIPAVPPSWQLASAELMLDVMVNNSGGTDPTPRAYDVNVWGLNDGLPQDAWVEGDGGTGDSPAGEIDWNNAPANNTANNDIIAAEATLLGMLQVKDTDVEGATVSFASTALTDFVSQDTNGRVTMILQRLTGNAWNLVFASKENTTYDSPALRLSFEPPAGSLFLVH